jgi:hypothetical protein
MLAGTVLSLSCSGTRPEVRAALQGTLPELEREIAQAEQGGPLDDVRLRKLARAVAEREIAGAGDGNGAEQVALFRGCLPEVQSVLEERASRGDEAAAVATLLLLEAGKRDARELVSRYREADSGAFRALAARATWAPADLELRRRYFTDPDERVRRGAFEAALRAPHGTQLSDLLEATRLDPSPANRARAARAAGRIGSEAAVLGLMDAFSAGDEQEQLTVLEAWAEPRSYRAGGERELARALGRPGLVSVSAASLLLRSRESRAAAVAVLARALAEGTDDERRLALASAPLSELSVKQALEKAAESPSPEVAPLVLSRLAELPGAGPKARAKLEKLAEDKGDGGLEASYALARLGSLRGVSRVEQELSSSRASRRLRAALTLASIGKKRRLAARLADPDPFVRATLSCRLAGAR